MGGLFIINPGDETNCRGDPPAGPRPTTPSSMGLTPAATSPAEHAMTPLAWSVNQVRSHERPRVLTYQTGKGTLKTTPC
jgi:hypothetical protein